MEKITDILGLICLIGITAMLVAIAVMALILMCRAIVEAIDEWRD